MLNLAQEGSDGDFSGLSTLAWLQVLVRYQRQEVQAEAQLGPVKYPILGGVVARTGTQSAGDFW
jgi:hypothetical protein